jgi:hypothetical protein
MADLRLLEVGRSEVTAPPAGRPCRPARPWCRVDTCGCLTLKLGCERMKQERARSARDPIIAGQLQRTLGGSLTRFSFARHLLCEFGDGAERAVHACRIWKRAATSGSRGTTFVPARYRAVFATHAGAKIVLGAKFLCSAVPRRRSRCRAFTGRLLHRCGARGDRQAGRR